MPAVITLPGSGPTCYSCRLRYAYLCSRDTGPCLCSHGGAWTPSWLTWCCLCHRGSSLFRRHSRVTLKCGVAGPPIQGPGLDLTWPEHPTCALPFRKTLWVSISSTRERCYLVKKEKKMGGSNGEVGEGTTSLVRGDWNPLNVPFTMSRARKDFHLHPKFPSSCLSARLW